MASFVVRQRAAAGLVLALTTTLGKIARTARMAR
jgi:hypothetical protein